jgi:Protein of unknown function (DUF559)
MRRWSAKVRGLAERQAGRVAWWQLMALGIGLLDHPPWPLQVTTPRRCRSLDGVRVYGRRGCARILHSGRTRSPLERTFLALCERAGIPMPDVNVWVAGVLVDAVWRDRRLVVELDGKDNHSSWAQIQDDRSKELRLRAAGFDVIRYGTRQVEEELDLVAADLYRNWSARSPAASA